MMPTLSQLGPNCLPKCQPEVFVSYAWGDTAQIASEESHQRQGLVGQMCKTLKKEGSNVIRDTNAMRTGDQISVFMKRIGRGDHVIVVLSDKYLRSPYCMAELIRGNGQLR
jgi:internalin A